MNGTSGTPETLEQVKQIIGALFSVEPAQLSQDSSTATVAGWDSMGQLMLVLELEQQFGLQIAPEVGEKLTSVADIVRFVEGART